MVYLYKWTPVYVTPLMVKRSFENFSDKSYKIEKRWVSLEEISPYLILAVIASEDNRFDTHRGFDWVEIDKAIDASKKGKKLRGASTITQQTAKNLFLLPSRSWVRKGLEAWFTILIEIAWDKRRVMEVYLNIAEMGRGIFGAEAAARHHFGSSAKRMSVHQSALIAATLPNPIKRSASKPGPYVSQRALQIVDLMNKIAQPEWLKNK